VYSRNLPDRRNKLDTTRGATNVKQIVIFVVMISVEDVDERNVTLAIFFNPDVLSHSI
jgi:hypothetical protein